MQTKHWSIVVIILISVLVFTNFLSSNERFETERIQKVIENTQSPVNELVKEYNEFLQKQIDSTSTVGAAVAIVCHDSLIFLHTYGVKKFGTTDSIDENTVFRLASVSKGFAGVLGAKLDNDNVLRLDDKIVDILPEFTLKDSVNTNNLTVKHTLNHTTGLVPHAFDNLVEAGIPMSEIIARFKEVEIAAEPGVVYGYQNAMFSIIDTVLRAKTGKPYHEHLQEQIFNPLEMHTATANTDAVNQNFAYPHIISSGKYVPVQLKTNYGLAAPAAGVSASISDMSKWLTALLGGSPEVLDTVVLNQITTPSVYTPLKRRYTWRWGDIKERYYSLGWRIFKYYNRDIVYHGGYLRGYRAEIAFCPEEKTGIVFLQNSPNKLASMSIPEFWKMYFAIRDAGI